MVWRKGVCHKPPMVLDPRKAIKPHSARFSCCTGVCWTRKLPDEQDGPCLGLADGQCQSLLCGQAVHAQHHSIRAGEAVYTAGCLPGIRKEDSTPQSQPGRQLDSCSQYRIAQQRRPVTDCFRLSHMPWMQGNRDTLSAPAAPDGFEQTRQAGSALSAGAVFIQIPGGELVPVAPDQA